MTVPNRFPACFYQSPSGREPVREFLRSLEKNDRQTLGTAIKKVELRWPVGMPLCRNLEKGLWEIRVKISGERIARVLFTPNRGHLVLLHAFIKKTTKTPNAELKLARTRWKDFLSHESEN